MNNHGGQLIVLEGVDGSGKTTLSRETAKRLGDIGFCYCSRKEIMRGDSFVATQMKKVASLMWTDNEGETDHQLPTHYWLYLQSLWYTMLSQFIIEPLLAHGKIVIVDGWFYKFIARLLVENFDSSYLYAIFSHVLEPDIVFLLDVDVEVIWNRGRPLRAYEMGSHQGYQGSAKEAFMKLQLRTLHYLKRFAMDKKWHVLSIDEKASIDECTELVRVNILRAVGRE